LNPEPVNGYHFVDLKDIDEFTKRNVSKKGYLMDRPYLSNGH